MLSAEKISLGMRMAWPVAWRVAVLSIFVLVPAWFAWQGTWVPAMLMLLGLAIGMLLRSPGALIGLILGLRLNNWR